MTTKRTPHTPGPWRIVERREETDSGVGCFLDIRGKPGAVAFDITAEDAPLIAAAPALYEALRDVMESVKKRGRVTDALCDRAFEALALAEKEEP